MQSETFEKIVYDAEGVEFNIYPVNKLKKNGAKTYWMLEDYSTGKRRLLSNTTKKGAFQRADEIRAAMVKGQANRTELTHGQWQDVCIALERTRRYLEQEQS